MKVKQEGYQMVIDSPPYGQIIMGLVFIGFTLGFLFFMARTVYIQCDRQVLKPVQCVVRETLFGLVEVGNRTVMDVRGATLEQHHSRKSGYTYRVAFVTGAGVEPLTPFYSSGYDEKKELSDQIDRFASNVQDSSLSARLDTPWYLLVVLSVFGVIGLFLLMTSYFLVVTLDKTSGVVKVEKDGLFHKVEEYLLGDLEGAHVASHRGSKGGRTYRVELHFHTGQNIPLSPVFSSGSGDKERVADQVNTFIASTRYATSGAPDLAQGHSSW